MTTIIQSEFSTSNNLTGGLGLTAVTVEQLTSNLMFAEFTLQSLEANGELDLAGADTTAVDLQDVDLEAVSFDTAFNFSVRWLLGTLQGTVKEQVYILGTLVSERDNIDPGYSVGADVKRAGPRYLLALNGTRYEVYVNFRPNTGQLPIASVPMPSDGPTLPVRAVMEAGLGVEIQDVRIGGFASTRASAAYLADEQTEDGIVTPYYLSLYQQPFYDGVPVNRLNVTIDPV